jgi:hypothetical protein
LIVSSRPSGVRDICGGTSIPLKVVLSASSSLFSTAVSDEMANVGIIRERSDQANIDGFMMAGYQGDEIEKRKPMSKEKGTGNNPPHRRQKRLMSGGLVPVMLRLSMEPTARRVKQVGKGITL